MTTPQQPPHTGEPRPSEPVHPVDERPIDLTDTPDPESRSTPNRAIPPESPDNGTGAGDET